MPSAPRGITRRSCRRCRDRLVSRRMPSDGRADEQEASASGPTDAPRARTRPGSSTTSNVMEQDSSDARYPDPVDVANPRRPDLSGSSPIDRATATRIMCCQLCVGCVRRRMRAHAEYDSTPEGTKGAFCAARACAPAISWSGARREMRARWPGGRCRAAASAATAFSSSVSTGCARLPAPHRHPEVQRRCCGSPSRAPRRASTGGTGTPQHAAAAAYDDRLGTRGTA